MTKAWSWIVLCVLCSGVAASIAWDVAVQTQIPGFPRFMAAARDDVDRALALAGVRAGEVVVDLGCGDGRVPVTAVRKFGAYGVCVEWDAELLQDARAQARVVGVYDRIDFVQMDLRLYDVGVADVIYLYLSPTLNAELAPQLIESARPGTRVVSLTHEMPWPVEAEDRWIAPDGRERVVRLYRVPHTR